MTRCVVKGSLGHPSKRSLTRRRNLQYGDLKSSEMTALLSNHFQGMI